MLQTEIEQKYHSVKELRTFFLDWYLDTELVKEKIGEFQREVAKQMNPNDPELGLFKFRNMLQTHSNYSYQEWKQIYEIVEKYDKYMITEDFFNTNPRIKWKTMSVDI